MIDRLFAAVRQVIRGELAELRFYGTYEYTVDVVTPVNTPNGQSCLIDGKPTDPDVTVPAISRVPVCPGLLAENVVATVGQLCRVRFVNGSPKRPEVVGLVGGVDASGAMFGSGSPAARVNDTVTVAFPPIAQVAGTVSGSPFVGIAQFTQPAVGVISTGSTKLKIGG